MIRHVARLGGILAFALAIRAQDTRFHAETNVATLTFSVEKNGRFLTTLSPDDLIVLENGKPQRFTLLGPLMKQGTPIDVILLADISSSVSDDHAGQVETFLRDAISTVAGQPGFTVTALAFSGHLGRFAGPLASAKDAERAAACLARGADCASSLERIAMTLPAARTASSRGSSWIFEAIIAAVRTVRPSSFEARRLLIVISDGGSSTSSEPRDAASAAHEESVPVYPIVVGRQQSATLAAAVGSSPAILHSDRFAQLGEMTGGRSFDLRHSIREIHEAVIRTAVTHARNQFVVGYAPIAVERKIRRTAEVRLRAKPLGTVRGGKRTFVH